MKKIIFAIPVMMVIAVSSVSAQTVKKQSSDQQANGRPTTGLTHIRADKPGLADKTVTPAPAQQSARQATPAKQPTPVGTTTNSDGTVKRTPPVMR